MTCWHATSLLVSTIVLRVAAERGSGSSSSSMLFDMWACWLAVTAAEHVPAACVLQH